MWGEPEEAILNDTVSIRTQDRLPRNMGVFNDVYTKFNNLLVSLYPDCPVH